MMDRLNTLIVSFAARTQREEGQTMAEYALVLALVALVAIVVLGTLGTNISGKFSSIASQLK
jgi:Flp pilus assembly pilin Flp